MIQTFIDAIAASHFPFLISHYLIMDLNLDSMLSGDPSFDPMLSGVSLQSLLNLNLNPNPSLLSDYPILSFLTDHPPPQPQDHKPLLIPKTEPPYHPTPHHHHHHHHLTPQPQPFNFFPKRPRLDHSTYYHPTTTTTYYSSPDTSSSSSSPSIRAKQRPSSAIPQSNLARQRRQKLSEKTRCLQKLMPWNKKMDQATLLEEAYKYVKFLQAQVSVLQSMPETSSSPVAMPPQRSNNNGGSGGVFGELERLSRNQVLQVLVNSPVAQTVMSSQGLCVFSAEQLGLLRKLSERRLLFQHMNMNIVSDSKPFFN